MIADDEKVIENRLGRNLLRNYPTIKTKKLVSLKEESNFYTGCYCLVCKI